MSKKSKKNIPVPAETMPEEQVRELGMPEVEADLPDDETMEFTEEETDFVTSAEPEGESFLPESNDDVEEEILASEISTEEDDKADLEGSELEGFESAEIEEVEFVEDERLESIIESILFASDRPVSLGSLKLVFKGTNVKTDKIRRTIERLATEYAGGRRGISLEEAPGGWQLRTKVDNMEFLRRTLKTRSFKLSGPALEVLSIVAYKQPTIKHDIDEIRGVESGHLLRALMEKNLVNFEGKSDLPGRPMLYGTTKKFLEIFGLRNLKELPTLSQIDELLPEGIGEEDLIQKPKLADITAGLSEAVESNYSIGEDELQKIQEQLEQISTSSEFFENEKQRQREARDAERAQNIREALTVGEAVPNRDVNWLKRFDEALAQGHSFVDTEATTGAGATGAGATVAGAAISSTDEEAISDAEARFEEDAAHPEDELIFDDTDAEGDEGADQGH